MCSCNGSCLVRLLVGLPRKVSAVKARLDGTVFTCTALTADDAGLTEENARREDYVDDHSD